MMYCTRKWHVKVTNEDSILKNLEQNTWQWVNDKKVDIFANSPSSQRRIPLLNSSRFSWIPLLSPGWLIMLRPSSRDTTATKCPSSCIEKLFAQYAWISRVFEYAFVVLMVHLANKNFPQPNTGSQWHESGCFSFSKLVIEMSPRKEPTIPWLPPTGKSCVFLRWD